MKQFATLESFFDSICSDLAASVMQFESVKRKAINDDIISGWFGKPQDQDLLGPVTEQSELIWRTLYLKQSVAEIRSVQDWAVAVPIRRVGLPKSEQLMFIWWVYLSRVNEFQDRLFKFYQAARLRAPKAFESKFVSSKKAFSKQFLLPIKPLIDLRNHWVHDSEPDFVELKRLASLELFITGYGIKPSSNQLVDVLKKEARRVATSEKMRLIKTLRQNESSFKKLADLVVLYSSQYASLYIPTSTQD